MNNKMVSGITTIIDLEESIKKRIWKQTEIEGDNIIQLLNFHINGKPLTVKLEDSLIVFQRILTNIDQDKCQTIANLLIQYMDLVVNCINGDLTVAIEKNKEEKTSRFVVDKLIQILNIIIDNFTNLAEKSLGVIKISILDKEVYVLKRRDIENFQYLKGLIVTIPDYSGWIETSIGRDNINLPLLSWTNELGELEIGYITGEKKLESINLTKIIDKIVKISDHLNLPRSLTETDLTNKEFLMNTIWKLRSLQTNGESVGIFQKSILEIEMDEAKKLLEDLVKIEKALAFNETLMGRVATRVASVAITKGDKKQLPMMGEETIVTTMRRVTKLGGGKAIYIGKEELRHIELSEKANVKVVKTKDGRKILVIEPL